MRRTSLTLLLAAWALGCGEAPPAPRNVTGYARLRTADGKLTPIGLGRTYFEAAIPDATGGWEVRRGLSSEDGTFTVSQVPAGGYWLRFHSSDLHRDDYLWTDATELAFDQDVPGRSGTEWASDSTRVHFDHVANLQKWEANDGLEFVSGSFGFAATVMNWPDVDTTTFDFTADWNGWPLLTPSDDAMLVQIHRDLGTVPFYTPMRVAKFPGLSVADGELTRASGAFEVAPAKSFHMVWKRSAFAVLAKSVHPTRALIPEEQDFELDAMPGGASRGILIPELPPVVGVEHDALIGNDDKDWSFEIRQPYPDDWLVARFAASFPVLIPVPGDPEHPPVVANVGVSLETNVLPTPEHPVTPTLSPVRLPKIAGKDLFADQSGVGLTPEVSWSQPEIGTPTAVIIDVFQWQGLESGVDSLIGISELAVPGDVTSVHLPPGVLKSGEKYVLSIRAVSQPGQDVRKHAIFQSALPHAAADVMGNTFQP